MRPAYPLATAGGLIEARVVSYRRAESAPSRSGGDLAALADPPEQGTVEVALHGRDRPLLVCLRGPEGDGAAVGRPGTNVAFSAWIFRGLGGAEVRCRIEQAAESTLALRGRRSPRPPGAMFRFSTSCRSTWRLDF